MILSNLTFSLLVLFATALPALEAPKQKIHSSLTERGNSQIVNQTIQELNETLFAPRSIHIELLKNRQEVIPVLVDWEYEAWSSYNPALTKEMIGKAFTRRLNDDQPPLTLIAFRENTLVGVISIDDLYEPELSDLADGNPWGESFHVVPEERNKGLGKDLAFAVATIAKRLGYECIYFYTSVPQNVKWYVQRNAEIIDTRFYHNHTITVMRFLLQ